MLAWIAVAVLSMGYLAQIVKIAQHKEVRDLSWVSYTLWALAYLILGYEAWVLEAPVFVFKNGLTFVLVTILIGQIAYHWNDEWHAEEDATCSCGNELEPHWNFCPDCGDIT